MYVGYWVFLTVSVFLGFLFVMFLLYAKFKKKRTQLETDPHKNQDNI